jgi:hypothetical protein
MENSPAAFVSALDSFFVAAMCGNPDTMWQYLVEVDRIAGEFAPMGRSCDIPVYGRKWIGGLVVYGFIAESYGRAILDRFVWVAMEGGKRRSYRKDLYNAMVKLYNHMREDEYFLPSS